MKDRNIRVAASFDDNLNKQLNLLNSKLPAKQQLSKREFTAVLAFHNKNFLDQELKNELLKTFKNNKGRKHLTTVTLFD